MLIISGINLLVKSVGTPSLVGNVAFFIADIRKQKWNIIISGLSMYQCIIYQCNFALKLIQLVTFSNIFLLLYKNGNIANFVYFEKSRIQSPVAT